MGNKFLHKILVVALVLMSASLSVQAEELCMEGTLLFREDFGGNDPNDPRVSTMPVPGMSYTQATTDVLGSMGGGKYLVTKQGYCNGNGTSQWHLQDDHTHFGDLTRGYLLEIDGRGDNAAFYATTIDGLCEGSHLTFSAYVANVMTWGMYMGRPGMYAYPRLKFVLADPVTDAELATYDTGDIPFDSAFIGNNMCWQQSVEWRLVGMNFIVPAGQNSIKLTIYNNATGSNGNDFAIDDIEVRLCAPPVTIEGETEVCENEAATLTANFTNDGTFAEPLGYKWFFSADSVSWETLDETSNVLSLSNVQKADSGWYRVVVAGADNIESLNCRAMSAPFLLKVNECVEDLCIDGTLLFREDFGGNSPSDPDVSRASVPGMDPSYHNSGNSLGSGNYTLRKEGWHNGIQWHWQDDHTYFGDKTRGYLLEVDGMGGAKPFYSKTIDGLCAGSRLTFSAYVVNVHYAGQLDYFGSSYVYPRMKFVLKDPETGAVLAEQSTGDIQPDWRYGTSDTWKYARDNQLSAEWQLIGMNFTVPDGVESIQMFIYNDVAQNGSGNDFALDDIEIHLCAPPVTIDGETEICADSSVMLTANFTNDGTFHEPLAYKWWHSLDSVTWTEMSGFNGEILTFSTIQKADSGWYKVAVSGDGNIENINCRAMSEPFRLRVNECTEDLCTDGILLFREDFGGNDPNDPMVGTDRVSGMDYSRYTQRLNADHVTGQAGLFWLIKSGYYHADTTRGRDPMKNHSNWYLQDDHTYPNDKTRGYLLEIDGLGGTAPFYSTVVHGVCPGTRLTFSAYVANVNKASNYIDGVHARIYPRLKFEIADAKTHTVLGSHSTGDIPYDPDLTVNTDFWYSSKWYLHGMTFTMPEAVDSIRLTIYNDVMNNGAGNDFALDDIEIRLCMTPDTIRTDTTVCDTLQHIAWRGKEYAVADTLRDTVYSHCGFDSIYYMLYVEMVHCDPPEQPLCMNGTLLFREDFGGNDPNDPMVSKAPMPGISSRYQQDAYYSGGRLAGMHYIIAKQGHPDSDSHAWHIMDDHTYPNDITRGYFFETNSRANSYYTNYIYQKEVAGLCAGMQLSFSAYFANVVTAREFKTVPFLSYSYPKFVFVVTDARTGEQLARYNTDTIGHDWSLYNIPDSWQYSAQWHLEGMNFSIPEGVDKVTLSIIDDPTQYGYAEGDDYAVDDIELHLCSNVEYQTVDTTICDTLLPFSWRGIEWIKADTIGKIYKDAQGNDSLYLVYSLHTIHCPYPPVSVSQDTTICDTLSQIKWHDKLFPITPEIRDTAYDAYGYDSVYYTLHVTRYHCPYPPVTISSDTTICDTLAQIAWRDKIYDVTSELRDTLYESYGADSVYFVLNISTETCCPYMIREQEHHYICDTLMPYVWHGFGDSAVIAEEGEHIIEIPSKRWPDCIAYRITVILNVEHCERLYPLIVNKYNWQLLLDNVTLRRLFPNRTATSYQWYKNEEPISGATEDDYAEQNELNGIFQLRVTLDGDQIIWSNILTISPSETEVPIEIKVYNWQNLYLIRYEQGDKVWTEKRLIP